MSKKNKGKEAILSKNLNSARVRPAMPHGCDTGCGGPTQEAQRRSRGETQVPHGHVPHQDARKDHNHPRQTCLQSLGEYHKKEKCECGVLALEKFPCGCMPIVCEEAGKDPALLLEARYTAKFWNELYEDPHEIAYRGSEFLAPGQSGLLAPPAKPIAPGRPSTKRIKGAMGKVSKIKASALSSQHG